MGVPFSRLPSSKVYYSMQIRMPHCPSDWRRIVTLADADRHRELLNVPGHFHPDQIGTGKECIEGRQCGIIVGRHRPHPALQPRQTADG